MRVISLVPSATEIVSALGFQDYIVGRSHECDFPLSIQRLPACTRSFIDSNNHSHKIDEDVKYRLINGFSIYQLNLDLILTLRPNVIITQSLCNICAIDAEEVKKNCLDMGFKEDTKIIELNAKDLEQIFDDVKKIADAIRDLSKGISLVNQMKKELLKLNTKALSFSKRPKIACIEWIEPLMAAGNWIPSLVELAGGVNLFSVKGKSSPWITADDLIAANPDIIIIMACGFDITRTIKEMPSFIKNEKLKNLKALINKQLFIVDANQFFVRPGPRIVDSLKILCEIIYPTKFNSTYKGTGWEHYVDPL